MNKIPLWKSSFPVAYVLLSVGIVLSLFIPFIQGTGTVLMEDISAYSVVHARTVWGTSFVAIVCLLAFWVYVDITKETLVAILFVSLLASLVMDVYVDIKVDWLLSGSTWVNGRLLSACVQSLVLLLGYLLLTQTDTRLHVSQSMLMVTLACSIILPLVVAAVFSNYRQYQLATMPMAIVVGLFYAVCFYLARQYFQKHRDECSVVILITLVPALMIPPTVFFIGSRGSVADFVILYILRTLMFVIPVLWMLISFRRLYFRKKSDEEEMVVLNQKLSKSEFRYGSISQLMPTGVMLIDESGTIVEANDHVCKLFGYSPDEFIGLTVEQLVPEHIRGAHVGLRKAFRRENKMRQMAKTSSELVGLRKDGSSVPVEIGLAPIELDQHHYTLTSVVDVSERRQMMEELKEKNIKMDMAIERLSQSNQQLERFAFVCSHDLQEPVRMVLSFSQFLERRLEGSLDEKSQEYLNYITDGAMRAREMITDILNFCRLDQNTDGHKQVDLTKTCYQVKNTLQEVLSERQAEFTWEDNLPVIAAVPSQIFQLILNLVSNGIKFNVSEVPAVHVSAVMQAENLQIRIQDNGIGIDKKYQEKVFEIFQRLNSKAEFPGTGIGLAICKKIADQHGASLSIESKAGKGSCFILEWPTGGNKKT
ncbi:sensor histidine kinase [Gynuella sp.]|uniref:sensor histidine kinase n=1 Tax=Gynuella sp. TaxID=2969146 RepID=UPI003D145F5B